MTFILLVASSKTSFWNGDPVTLGFGILRSPGIN